MSEKRLRWGILSTARIADQKVIPAIQDSRWGTVTAIASRHLKSAQNVAQTHQIPIVCPSYHDLLNVDTIDAVYIPLPNHLHVEWAAKALEAGKHVLCEKPLGLSTKDVLNLLNVSERYPRQLVAEAFMYRHHPQWVQTHEWVRSHRIGELCCVHVHFSYNNLNPEDIRNKVEFGGGALMDIGCYGISVARWFFGAEPIRVCARMERHPEFQTDISTTVLLDFSQGSATVCCGTQMERAQSVRLIGTKGQILLEQPFNLAPDQTAPLKLQQNQNLRSYQLGPANQFSLQFDAFASSVFDETPLASPITSSLHNMHVIDACVESANTDAWIHC